MEPALLALTIIGSVAAGTLVIVMLYFTSLIRRTNIVMKKVDYLVEELTYKAESLTVAVDAIRKLSNYVLAADAFTQKGFKSLFKFLSQNKNFFYGFIDKLRTDSNITNKTKSPNKKTSETEKKINYSLMSVTELREQAKLKSIKVTTTMKKADLIKILK